MELAQGFGKHLDAKVGPYQAYSLAYAILQQSAGSFRDHLNPNIQERFTFLACSLAVAYCSIYAGNQRTCRTVLPAHLTTSLLRMSQQDGGLFHFNYSIIFL